jgi:uncharacterized membrane protein
MLLSTLTTTVLVVIVIVAILVIAGIALGAWRRREETLEGRRVAAAEHREHADASARRAQ